MDKKVKYEKDILLYLEEKYNEEFEIKQLSRILSLGSADTVYASCCSRRFPNDLFEASLQLSVYDIYDKEEIIDIFKQAEIYEGELDKEGNSEKFISDNYINVIIQNQFDEGLNIEALFVKTQITTPNKYLNEPDKDITPEVFFEKYNDDTVIYTSVFVNDETILEDSEFLSASAGAIVNDKLKNQLIFYYATDLTSEETERLYAENYDDNNEYFYEAGSTKKYIVEKYTFGEKD